MKRLLRLVIALVLGVTGVATAASSTNEWIGISRLLSTGNQWTPAVAPINGAVFNDWLIGGSGFKSFTAQGDLVVNSASPAYRVYADTVYIASGINNLTNSSGTVYELGFAVAGSVDNRIVVKSGFDIASGVTNNVILKSTKWASSNANNAITFNHKGTGTLRIQNDWVETPGVGMVYKGSAGNKVEFGATSTYTGGTTLDNISASVISNISIGATAGNVVLTNGSSLNLSTFTLSNKVVAAVGSDVKTVISGTAVRTSAIEAQGNMLLTNSGSGAVQWNGAVTVGSGAQLDIANSAGAATTYLGGTLSGNGTLRTSIFGTTVLNTNLNTSGFGGDTVIRGVAHVRGDNAFGSGTIVLTNGANLRGFGQAVKLGVAFTNGVSVQADSRLALTASTGLTGNTASMTVGGDITFAKDNATLSLEASGNLDNTNGANTLTINGVIKEAAGVTGHLLVDNHWTTGYYTNSITKLSGVNTYHGKTDVQFGRLQLVNNGSIDNSTNLHVQAQGVFDVSTRTGGAYTYGGTVDGTGLIVGNLTLTGNLNPGNSPGTLNFADALTLGSTATTTFQIVSNLSFDVLNGDGGNVLTAQNGTKFVFDFAGNTTVSNGSTFAVLQNWATLTDNGATFSVTNLASGLSLNTSSLFTTGYVTVVPEPATIGMLGLGALITVMLRRMRMC